MTASNIDILTDKNTDTFYSKFAIKFLLKILPDGNASLHLPFRISELCTR